MIPVVASCCACCCWGRWTMRWCLSPCWHLMMLPTSTAIFTSNTNMGVSAQPQIGCCVLALSNFVLTCAFMGEWLGAIWVFKTTAGKKTPPPPKETPQPESDKQTDENHASTCHKQQRETYMKIGAGATTTPPTATITTTKTTIVGCPGFSTVWPVSLSLSLSLVLFFLLVIAFVFFLSSSFHIPVSSCYFFFSFCFFSWLLIFCHSCPCSYSCFFNHISLLLVFFLLSFCIPRVCFSLSCYCFVLVPYIFLFLLLFLSFFLFCSSKIYMFTREAPVHEASAHYLHSLLFIIHHCSSQPFSSCSIFRMSQASVCALLYHHHRHHHHHQFFLRISRFSCFFFDLFMHLYAVSSGFVSGLCQTLEGSEPNKEKQHKPNKWKEIVETKRRQNQPKTESIAGEKVTKWTKDQEIWLSSSIT